MRGLLTVLVVTLVSGCGGSSEGSNSAATTEHESSLSASALGEVRDDFTLNFSGVSWSTPPETLEIEGNTLVARTDFYPRDEGRDLGKQLCNALNGNYVLSNTADYGLEGVTVHAQDDPVAYSSGGGIC